MLNAKKYFLSLFFLLLALTLPAILIMNENYFNWFLSIPGFFYCIGNRLLFFHKRINEICFGIEIYEFLFSDIIL